jgi:hypothetical protein
MIRPLRHRHRRAFFALGILLPAALVAGLAVRRSEPVIQTAEVFAVEQPHLEQVVWERGDLWSQFPIRTRLLSSAAAGQKFAVELTITKDIVKPDLIVYWVPGNLKVASSLPDNAILLGAFVQTTPTQLSLPVEAITNKNGVLLLYSLADHEVVAVSKPLEIGKVATLP